jgi:hypothetical protein
MWKLTLGYIIANHPDQWETLSSGQIKFYYTLFLVTSTQKKKCPLEEQIIFTYDMVTSFLLFTQEM